MIEECYVRFNTARMLKEIGLDVPCRGVYLIDRTGYYEFREYDNKQTADDLLWNTEDGFQYEYLAPTQALAAKWLREVYGIHVMIHPYYDCSVDADGEIVDKQMYWGYMILYAETGNLAEDNDERFDNYEQDLEAGLRGVVKLIKK